MAVSPPMESHRRGIHQIATRREHAQEKQVIQIMKSGLHQLDNKKFILI
jgi:hypothetical protein